MTEQALSVQPFSLIPVPADGPLPSWMDGWLAELDRVQVRSRGCPPRDPAAARSALRAHLARREVAVARTADGWAFCAVRRVVHPLTGLAETSLTRFAATAAEPAALLLDELARRDLLDRCTVETEAAPDGRQRALIEHGFTENVLVLRHPLEPAAGPDAAGPGPALAELDLHPVRGEETGFVIECLATALRRGLAGTQPATDLAAWAREHYLLDDGSALCLVGRLDGIPVGHGLGYRRKDRYGIDSVLYLVDVFVVPSCQGRGLSRAISAEIMRVAAREGYQVVESDVLLTSSSDGLRQGLRAAGWSEDRIRWGRG
jgi:GNAT superfamily N-acetyltransferase